MFFIYFVILLLVLFCGLGMWWVLLFLVVGIFVLIRYSDKIIYVIVVMLCYGLFYKNLDIFECKKKKEYCCIFINMKMRVF